jgi:hypothetical protein
LRSISADADADAGASRSSERATAELLTTHSFGDELKNLS